MFFWWHVFVEMYSLGGPKKNVDFGILEFLKTTVFCFQNKKNRMKRHMKCSPPPGEWFDFLELGQFVEIPNLTPQKNVSPMSVFSASKEIEPKQCQFPNRCHRVKWRFWNWCLGPSFKTSPKCRGIEVPIGREGCRIPSINRQSIGRQKKQGDLGVKSSYIYLYKEWSSHLLIENPYNL